MTDTVPVLARCVSVSISAGQRLGQAMARCERQKAGERVDGKIIARGDGAAPTPRTVTPYARAAVASFLSSVASGIEIASAR